MSDVTTERRFLYPTSARIHWPAVSTIDADPDNPILTISIGMFAVKLTPEAAGVYTYRVTFDGDDQYAPAVSNVVTLTVTNMIIS
jgi:hypothetical protein